MGFSGFEGISRTSGAQALCRALFCLWISFSGSGTKKAASKEAAGESLSCERVPDDSGSGVHERWNYIRCSCFSRTMIFSFSLRYCRMYRVRNALMVSPR